MSIHARLTVISESIRDLIFEGWETEGALLSAIEQLEPLMHRTATEARDTRRLLLVIWGLMEHLLGVLEKAERKADGAGTDGG